MNDFKYVFDVSLYRDGNDSHTMEKLFIPQALRN